MSQQSIQIHAPQEQEEGTRSQLLRWLKRVGEPVSEHEPLIELETEKVTVEVPAPASGVLAEILKAEQEEVTPGEVLGRIELGTAGTGTAGTGTAEEAPRESESTPKAAAQPAATRSVAPGAGGAQRLSPAVRRLLSERGLTAAQVSGTGEGGRITVDDVMRHGAGAQPAPAQAQPAAPTSTAAAGVAVRTVPHTAVRKRIAARMVESLLHTAPHVTTVFQIDLSAVLEHRRAHREAFASRGVQLTLTAYFVRAAIEAIAVVPEANSRWGESALEIYETVNFGIGTAAPEGLVVPVLRDAQSLDLERTAQGIEALVRRAREGALAPADMRGSTFTISNHGVSGSLFATPIILHPGQAAILGVGKLEKRAVVIEHDGEDRIEIRPCCYATLTIDHRVMDGERANRFMQVFAERIGRWSE